MARLGAKWELVKVNAPPFLQWVRYVPIMDPNGPKLAQIAVTFDTTQAVSKTVNRKTTVKEQRVIEHVVFERSNAANAPWRIKSTAETTWPTF